MTEPGRSRVSGAAPLSRTLCLRESHDSGGSPAEQTEARYHNRSIVYWGYLRNRP